MAKVDANKVIRDLMDVARVAVQAHHPVTAEGLALIPALLAVIDREMPPALQEQDQRIVAARALLTSLSTASP